MKRLAIPIVLTVLLVNFLTTESRSAIETPRFVSLEGRFSISLPARFKQLTRLTIPIPSGNAYGKLYEWQTKGRTFSIGYADWFQPIGDPEAVNQFFEVATEHFRRLAVAANGNVGVVKSITLEKHPGIEQRADINAGSFIQRTFLVSRRIYQTRLVVRNSQRDESAAVDVLDSFKLLSDLELTKEALKAGPGPLPQTPEARRAGSDADDAGLRGAVKSVRTEIQYISVPPAMRASTRFSVTTYNEKRNKLRTESYDFKDNLFSITVYGYLDGARVSASKYIEREYGPSAGFGGGIGGYFPSNRKRDPRYDHRFEFKYDEKKRLTEQTDFLSNGDRLSRRVYKYEGNQKEEQVYENDSLIRRTLETLDDKGNVIERIDFGRDGSVRSTTSYTYEFDANGNWTKQTTFAKEGSDKPEPRSVQLRTITYY